MGFHGILSTTNIGSTMGYTGKILSGDMGMKAACTCGEQHPDENAWISFFMSSQDIHNHLYTYIYIYIYT